METCRLLNVWIKSDQHIQNRPSAAARKPSASATCGRRRHASELSLHSPFHSASEPQGFRSLSRRSGLGQGYGGLWATRSAEGSHLAGCVRCVRHAAQEVLLLRPTGGALLRVQAQGGALSLSLSLSLSPSLLSFARFGVLGSPVLEIDGDGHQQGVGVALHKPVRPPLLPLPAPPGDGHRYQVVAPRPALQLPPQLFR